MDMMVHFKLAPGSGQQGCRDGAVVAHPTSNQGDAGSIPTHGTNMFFHSKRIDQLVVRCRCFFFIQIYIYIYIYIG